MTIKEFTLKEGNHFVAMEYYGMILNRTFLVLLSYENVTGILANGLVSIEGGKDLFTRELSKNMAVRGDLLNPFSYIKEKYIARIANEDLFGTGILSANKANFRMETGDIEEVWYDKRKKWGMGYYPHDGKVYIKTKNHKKREFIILGNQSGEDIKNWILALKR